MNRFFFRCGRCVPEFKATLARIATAATMPVLEVYGLWREYAQSCENGDMSPILSEFVDIQRRVRGWDREATDRALYPGEDPAPAIEAAPVEVDRVAEITQGRTIWDSDGTAGPVLLCAPPAPAVSVPAPDADGYLFTLV